MNTPTLIVAANGYTRDELSAVIHRACTGSPLGPTIRTWAYDTIRWSVTFRFVTDNDLDDGEFRVVGQE